MIPGPTAPLPSQVQPELPDLADDLFVRLSQPLAADRYLSADDALEDIYRADALHWFMDPRDALFFLSSVAGAAPLEEADLEPGQSSDIMASSVPGEAGSIGQKAYKTMGYHDPGQRPPYSEE